MGANSLFRLLVAALAVAFVLAPVSASSTVHTVRQDGTGDFTNITDAVNASAPEDTIEVGPGTYTDSIDLYDSLTFLSTDGPEVTIIDGGGVRHHLWFFGGEENLVVGFTLRNGYNSSGGGSIRADLGADVTIRDCVFEANHSDFHAGAVFAKTSGAVVDAFDCTFVGNTSDHNGGAMTTVVNSDDSRYAMLV